MICRMISKAQCNYIRIYIRSGSYIFKMPNSCRNKVRLWSLPLIHIWSQKPWASPSLTGHLSSFWISLGYLVTLLYSCPLLLGCKLGERSIVVTRSSLSSCKTTAVICNNNNKWDLFLLRILPFISKKLNCYNLTTTDTTHSMLSSYSVVLQLVKRKTHFVPSYTLHPVLWALYQSIGPSGLRALSRN